MEHYSFNDMLNALKDLDSSLGDLDLESYERKLDDSDKYRDFLEDFTSLRHEVKNATEHAKIAIESPIYSGIMGHYSHGKSSVLNALLFPQKGEWLLPTGEGIVTSLPTLVAFNAKGRGDSFTEIKPSGSNPLTKDTFIRKASGKLSLEDVDYFSLRLDSGNLATEIFEQFSSKKIELLDTPGLGGPYWNDEHNMQKWVKECALLIVCIKADSINENTALTLNPFLRMSANPVIPVVTFWDLWKKSADYQGISDDKRARAHSKELIKKHFPSLTDAADLAQFVSAKNYENDVTVPDDGSTTAAWGIDNLRSAISTFVNDKNQILQSIKKESSGIDLQRKNAVIQCCQEVESVFNSFAEQSKERIKSFNSDAEYTEELDEKMDRVSDEIDREFQEIANRLEQKVSDHIGTIEIDKNFQSQMSEIQKNTNALLQQMLNDSIGRRLERSLTRLVINGLTRWAEKNSPLSKTQLTSLERDIESVTKRFIEDLTSAQRVEVVSIPTGVDAMMQNYGQIIFSLNGIKSIAIGIGLMILAQNIPFDYVKTFLWAAAFGIPSFMLWSELGHAKQKTLLDLQNRARADNKYADIRKHLVSHTQDKLKEYRVDILDVLERHIATLKDTSDEMIGDIGRTIDDLGRSVRALHKMASDLHRSI